MSKLGQYSQFVLCVSVALLLLLSTAPANGPAQRCLVGRETHGRALRSIRALVVKFPHPPRRGQRPYSDKAKQICRHPKLLVQKLVRGPVDQSAPRDGDADSKELNLATKFLTRHLQLLSTPRSHLFARIEVMLIARSLRQLLSGETIGHDSRVDHENFAGTRVVADNIRFETSLSTRASAGVPYRGRLGRVGRFFPRRYEGQQNSRCLPALGFQGGEAFG